jgi:hypothetical protein
MSIDARGRCRVDRAAEARTVSTKECRACRREQPIENFGKDSRSADGRNPRCRSCRSHGATVTSELEARCGIREFVRRCAERDADPSVRPLLP